MKQLILFITLSFLLLQSCNKKNVMLPLSEVKGIQDTIYNNSKIWLFFNENNGDTIAELNKNNKVGNTHFIFNIDKRLKLKHITEHLNKIQIKKEQPSMHSNGEYMHSYLSYVDVKEKKLSMVNIDSVKFKPYINGNKNNITLYFNTKNNTFLNDSILVKGDLIKILNTYKKSPNKIIDLIFDKNLTYAQYVSNKAVIQLLKKDSIKFNAIEYIK